MPGMSGERNMSDAVMRGIVAWLGSQTTSRLKGWRWNLGDLLSPAVPRASRAGSGSSDE